METYWIIIAGLKGAGKSAFLTRASETITLRDSADMSMITPEQDAAVLRWLAETGGALDPYREVMTAEEVLFTRWSRRVRVGEIPIDHRMRVCLYEARREVDALWATIPPETLLGSIIVIDSANHVLIRDASRLAAAVASYAPTPYVFAANKQDNPDALPPEDIRILLQFLDGHLLPVVPCVATEEASVKGVLLALLEQVRESYDDGIIL